MAENLKLEYDFVVRLCEDLESEGKIKHSGYYYHSTDIDVENNKLENDNKGCRDETDWPPRYTADDQNMKYIREEVVADAIRNSRKGRSGGIFADSDAADFCAAYDAIQKFKQNYNRLLASLGTELTPEIDLDTATIQELIPYPEWMDEYNVRLGGRTPNQAIQDGDEARVREILIYSIVVGIS